jgi:PIN domain nuclease of toxin-antitoxin system
MEWTFLPLTAHHATTGLIQPLEHKDPFDELLLVQAQEEGMLVLTRDAKLAWHGCSVHCP